MARLLHGRRGYGDLQYTGILYKLIIIIINYANSAVIVLLLLCKGLVAQD